MKLVFTCDGESITVLYRSLRDGRFRFPDGTTARVHAWNDGGIDVEIGDRRVKARVTRFGDTLTVHGPAGDLTLREEPRFVVPGGEEATGGFVVNGSAV